MIVMDENLKTNIYEELKKDPRIDEKDIRMKIQEGSITLEGEVPSFNDFRTVLEIIKSADSNMVINNKLKINYQHGRKIPEDEKIRKHIENSLSWDTRFDERYLEVSVEGGNVQLKGVVDSYWKVPEIEKKISGIYGVNSIQNNLTVVPSRELQDRTIAQKISGSLNRARDIDTSNIQITVDNGEVTLSGTVLKKYQKNIAEEITMFTPGVVLVNNDLLVKK